jgi:hypothetical protein
MAKPKFHEVKIGLDSACYPPLPNWQPCILLSTRKPTKYSIRKGHPVEIAYYLPGEDGEEEIFHGELKEEDIVEFEYKRVLERKEALKIFEDAGKYVTALEKNQREELEKTTEAKNKLFEVFPELNPLRQKGTYVM